MKRKNASIQPDLFEQDELASCRPSHRRNSWQRWSNPCLLEIAAALASGEAAMTKITADHLGRSPSFTSQSTRISSCSNRRARRRQYGLADRARQLRLDHGRGHRR